MKPIKIKTILDEHERIKKVYGNRDIRDKHSVYAWYRPEVRQQDAYKDRIVSSLLYNTLGNELANINILDVGCGSGGFLRKLIEWGATPDCMVGTELLEDRLVIAKERSPATMTWHLGGLEFAHEQAFDLVTAHTVFSSVLNPLMRKQLAEDMWSKVKPGGWVLIYDFRFNNPKNSNVKKVTTAELLSYWGSDKHIYKSLVLAPPIARFITPISYLLSELLVGLLPFLRTHFFLMVHKPTNAS